MRKRNYIKTDQGPRSSVRRKLFVVLGILLAAYIIVSCIFGEMGLIKYYRMKVRSNALTNEIAALKRDNAKLRQHVHSLKNDPLYVERIARDKLGLARPGEIVYYYNEQRD